MIKGENSYLPTRSSVLISHLVNILPKVTD